MRWDCDSVSRQRAWQVSGGNCHQQATSEGRWQLNQGHKGCISWPIYNLLGLSEARRGSLAQLVQVAAMQGCASRHPAQPAAGTPP